MKLSEETISAIKTEYAEWESRLWAGNDLKTRQKLGQFATPPELTIKMLEKFDSLEDKDILDPTVGAGSLLAAAVIAGADPKRVYGIELDKNVLEVCRQRLGKLGVPAANLKCGNALDSDAYEFGDEAEPAAHGQESADSVEQEADEPAAEEKLALPECRDASSIIGRKMDEIIASMPSASASGVWRAWAGEAKAAYARYNSWKTGKPAAEVKSVHAAYRQWKTDEEAVWCKHFGKVNPNDRQHKKNAS